MMSKQAYRLFYRGWKQRIERVEIVYQDHDSAAVEAALLRAGFKTIEVWQRARLVAIVPPQATRHAASERRAAAAQEPGCSGLRTPSAARQLSVVGK